MDELNNENNESLLSMDESFKKCSINSSFVKTRNDLFLNPKDEIIQKKPNEQKSKYCGIDYIFCFILLYANAFNFSYLSLLYLLLGLLYLFVIVCNIPKPKKNI